MSNFHPLKIKSIQKETDNAVCISFDIPSDLQSIFVFKAGQYITLKTIINDNEVRRDYSLCTNPNSGELTVIIKEVSDGVFSKYANSNLNVGDSIDVATPNGRFIFEPDPDSKRTIVAFAAGSGITPIMSIARTVLEQEPDSNFVLVYGNKTPNDTIFYSALLDLKTMYDHRFQLKFVFSQCQETDALFGRIEKSSVNYVLNQMDASVDVDAFYICGPEAMINNVKSTLIERGVPDDKIKFELFTVSTDTTENTETPISDGKTFVTVLVDDEEATFTMSQTKTILEEALSNDIDAPYSCQGGICSSCIARLKEGKVEMRQNNILTDSEIEEGLILTCQSQPTTPTVTVDYDDV